MPSLDLGSDLLDELEQAKYFSTRDAACRSMRHQLEKLSTLTKQHATLLEDCEKRLKDCVEICQLQKQANEVIDNGVVGIEICGWGYCLRLSSG